MPLCIQLKLLNPSSSRFEHLVTQMKWRLREGRGEAIYEIGVADNGLLLGLSENDLTSSLNTLNRMADRYIHIRIKNLLCLYNICKLQFSVCVVLYLTVTTLHLNYIIYVQWLNNDISNQFIEFNGH